MLGSRLIAAFLCSVSMYALAAPSRCELIRTVAGDDVYPNVAATVAAMRRAHLAESIRTDREYVGAVLERREGYSATVGAGCAGRDTVTFAVTIPDGARVAAFWHTHGAPDAFRDLFSADDVELVRAMHRDFYLITPRGELRVLRVADVLARSPARIARGAPTGAATGVAVARAQREHERVAKQLPTLPSTSRGAVPIG